MEWREITSYKTTALKVENLFKFWIYGFDTFYNVANETH